MKYWLVCCRYVHSFCLSFLIIYCHGSSTGYTELMQAVNGTLELQYVAYLICISTGQSVSSCDIMQMNADMDSRETQLKQDRKSYF